MGFVIETLNRIRWTSDAMRQNISWRGHEREEMENETRSARNCGRCGLCGLTFVVVFGAIILWSTIPCPFTTGDMATVVFAIPILGVAACSSVTGIKWFESFWTPFTRTWAEWMMSCIPFIFTGWFFAIIIANLFF